MWQEILGIQNEVAGESNNNLKLFDSRGDVDLLN